MQPEAIKDADLYQLKHQRRTLIETRLKQAAPLLSRHAAQLYQSAGVHRASNGFAVIQGLAQRSCQFLFAVRLIQ
jgi:hypothetical protein